MYVRVWEQAHLELGGSCFVGNSSSLWRCWARPGQALPSVGVGQSHAGHNRMFPATAPSAVMRAHWRQFLLSEGAFCEESHAHRHHSTTCYCCVCASTVLLWYWRSWMICRMMTVACTLVPFKPICLKCSPQPANGCDPWGAHWQWHLLKCTSAQPFIVTLFPLACTTTHHYHHHQMMILLKPMHLALLMMVMMM